MSHIVKVLLDDHSRLRRMFANYRAQPTNPDLALGLCDELRIQAALEEELVHPILEKSQPKLAKMGAADRAAAEKLISRLEKLEPGTREFLSTMVALEDEVEAHITTQASEVLPLLKNIVGGEGDVLGVKAFGLRRELIAELPEHREVGMTVKALPNGGWGPGKVANAGW